MQTNGRQLSKRLKSLAFYKVIFAKHAELRLVQRKIEKSKVVEHLKKPGSLKLVEKLESKKRDEKYKLWFRR